MARETPGKYRRYGITFSIRGQPLSRRTRIEILLVGAFKKELRDVPQIRINAMRLLYEILFKNCPVDTGMLRASIRLELSGRSPTVSLGPEPYDRTALKARLAGRGRVKRRRPGRPRKSKFYALPANARSTKERYIENSIDFVAPRIVRAIREYRNAQRELQTLQQVRLTHGIIGRN